MSGELDRDRRWWLAPKNEAHAMVCRVAEHLLDQQKRRETLDLRHARLYGNWRYSGLSPSNYWTFNPEDRRLGLNIIASVIDTASSKIAQNRPAPKFVPNGGDWSLRRKAKRLNKFGKGVLHASGAYRVRGQCFRDACIFGTGIAKTFSRDNELCTERRFRWDVLVDDQEAVYGEPRTLIERRCIDKAILLNLFKAAKGSRLYREIQAAKPSERDAPLRSSLSEQIEVYEAWHLPSSKNAGDGRHVIVIPGVTLRDEDWKRAEFPFSFYHWVEPVAGFWGQGLAERLTGIQFEINKLLDRIQRSIHLLGVPWVVLDEAAGIPETHVTNEIACILLKSGGLPGNEVRVQVNQTVHPEVFQYIWTLEEKAYSQEGISQAYAQGRKPVGLNSGIAQRERNDIESERFILAGQRWETFHMDIVERALDEVRELGDGFQLNVPGRKWGEKIKWGEVAMAADAYNLGVWPVSILPQTPSARLEKAQELFAVGLMTADGLAEALDLPDVDRAQARTIASAEVIEWAIDKMLDEGEQIAPEPFDNLDLAVARVTAAYQEERVQGAPDERLDLLRDYLDDCQALIEDAQRGQQMAAAPPMAAPAPDAAMGAPPMAAAPMGVAA